MGASSDATDDKFTTTTQGNLAITNAEMNAAATLTAGTSFDDSTITV
jgi:hypothetical protein